MPIPNEYHPIIEALLEKTGQGALDWEDNSLQISVVIDQSKFTIWSGSDEETNESFVAFGLFGKNQSKAIDSWYVDESDRDYDMAYSLFKLAKRHANGVPDLLKNLAERISTMKKNDG